jgi:hypothetical protein
MPNERSKRSREKRNKAEKSVFFLLFAALLFASGCAVNEVKENGILSSAKAVLTLNF